MFLFFEVIIKTNIFVIFVNFDFYKNNIVKTKKLNRDFSHISILIFEKKMILILKLIFNLL